MTTQTMPQRTSSATTLELDIEAAGVGRGGRRLESLPLGWEDVGPIALAELPPCGTD